MLSRFLKYIEVPREWRQQADYQWFPSISTGYVFDIELI